MAYHKHATPNFRNLIVRPMWITLKAALRTIPYIGRAKFLQKHGTSKPYHRQKTNMLSDAEREMYTAQAHPVVDQTYAPDRETTELFPYFERPVTVMSVSYTHLTLPTNREV